MNLVAGTDQNHSSRRPSLREEPPFVIPKYVQLLCMFMPEYICTACGIRLFHENETTLKVEVAIHKKFCRKKSGTSYSYMHRDAEHMDTFDAERANDADGTPILK